MAQFIGKVQGARGETSRLGSKNSGMCGSVDGWDVGTNIFATVDEDLGTDIITVHVTGGSNSGSKQYGTLDARQVDGTDVLLSVDEALLGNCDLEHLAATIMCIPDLVSLLRGRIFIEGKADGA